MKKPDMVLSSRSPEKPAISADGRRPWEVESPTKIEALPGQPVNFFSLTLEDLKGFLKGLGKEQFRAQQIFKWVYESKVTDFDALAVVIPPRALGEFRKKLHKEAERRLVLTINKEMTDRPIPDIEELLAGESAPPA